MPKLNEDTILFIENDATVNGAIYLAEFDRMFQALIHQPGFNNVRGIVLGRAEKSSDMNREKWEMMIKNKKELDNIPIIVDADFGHTTPIFTFPIGGMARMSVNEDEVKLFIND